MLNITFGYIGAPRPMNIDGSFRANLAVAHRKLDDGDVFAAIDILLSVLKDGHDNGQADFEKIKYLFEKAADKMLGYDKQALLDLLELNGIFIEEEVIKRRQRRCCFAIKAI